MLVSVYGNFKNGRVFLDEEPEGISESRVIVTFLEPLPTKSAPEMLKCGMFAGERETNEEDFKIAEWHGEPEFDE